MAKKRAVGEGSISRRKDGRWEVAIRAMTTAGTRKRIRKYAKTRTEAEEQLVELRQQIRQGSPVPDRTWKLGAYLDYWLNQVVRPSRRAATYEKDEPIVRIHLKPGLGGVALPRLTVSLLQAFFNEQQECGKSLATVHEMRKVLSAALTRAMKEELIARNPARLVDLAPYVTRRVKPWSLDEASQFLEAARTDPLYPAFVLSILYGLRRGEVLGLRWSDIDFEKNVLEIRQQLQRRSSGLLVGPLKTNASERDLRLRPMAREVLLMQQATQNGARAQVGASWLVADEAEALVFTTGTGRPIEPRNFVRSFQRICEQNGIRRIRVHDVRHTLATFASELHASPKDAQFTLGHSQVSTTMGVYQHGSIDSSDRVVGAVEALLGGTGIDGSGPHASRHDLRSSRQIWPSSTALLGKNVASTSGAVFGIRTRDPFLTIAPGVDASSRFATALQISRNRQLSWVLGLVAVSAGRQILERRPATQAQRSTSIDASSVHTSRCATSARSPYQPRGVE